MKQRWQHPRCVHSWRSQTTTLEKKGNVNEHSQPRFLNKFSQCSFYESIQVDQERSLYYDHRSKSTVVQTCFKRARKHILVFHDMTLSLLSKAQAREQIKGHVRGYGICQGMFMSALKMGLLVSCLVFLNVHVCPTQTDSICVLHTKFFTGR